MIMYRPTRFMKLSLIMGYSFLYAPILMVVMFSFSGAKVPGHWGGFSTQWYEVLWHDRTLHHALWVSLRIATTSATLALLLGTIGALLMVRFSNLKRRELFYGLATAPLVIPDIILGLGMALLFVLLKEYTGWPHQLGIPTITLAHTTVGMAYVIIVVRSRLAEMDYHLEEAALDLGAKPYRVFMSITLPIIAPALFSGWLLAFTLSLDDVVLASFLTGPGSTPLAVEIFSQIRYGLTPKINALATIMITVIAVGATLCAYFIHRRAHRAIIDDMAT